MNDRPKSLREVERLHRRRAAGRARQRPALEPIPAVLAGVVDEDRRGLDARRALLQVLVEERLQHVAAELQRGVAIPLQRAERGAVVVHLAVAPRSHHQVVAIVGAILRLDLQPRLDRAPHVLLVPQALDPHGRHGQRLLRHHPDEVLALPEGVVGRVLAQLPPGHELIEAVRLREGPGRPEPPVHLVVVVVAAPDAVAGAADRRLAGDEVEAGLAKGAVVEPVVAHPAVDHRAHRRRDLQRRVRVHQGHHHGEALVGAAEHADAAVRLGHVLHEPLDRVVGVGRVIGRRRVERPAQRPREHVVAFRAVLAAHVLEDADVAVGDEHLVALRQRRQQVRRGVARGAPAGVVGRARHDHRRAAGALGHDDHGEELDAVPHRDHHLAPLVVVAGARGHVGLADVRRAWRRLGGLDLAG